MLCLDLDIMERNARVMAEHISRSGKQWRPHVKSHCLPQIASTLMEFGAIGVTAASVAEAEVMARAGVPSVLLAHLVANPMQLKRLPNINTSTELLLTIDHFVHAELLSELAGECGQEFQVLVDIDIGMHRTGVRPGHDAAELAAAADKLPGVRVVGVMGYEGHLLQLADADEKRRLIFEGMNVLQHSRDLIRRHDIPCDILSAGGTGSFQTTSDHPAVTELQAGGGIFGDLFYTRNCRASDLESAMWVTADVVSRPSLNQAVLNCGRKVLNPDLCLPAMRNLPDATIQRLSAEHAVVEVSGPARDLRIGDTVSVTVGYSDLTILLHRRLHVFRGEALIDVWEIQRPV
ncbi:MAG: alanine racemase [Planctomycetaceae bacterium]